MKSSTLSLWAASVLLAVIYFVSVTAHGFTLKNSIEASDAQSLVREDIFYRETWLIRNFRFHVHGAMQKMFQITGLCIRVVGDTVGG